MARLRAEELLEEKTAECELTKENLEKQVQYGGELKRGILGYKEQKKQNLEKIRYLTRKLHGEAVDEEFELKKVLPVVDVSVQCEFGQLTVHGALFGGESCEAEVSHPPTTTVATPLSPKNDADSSSVSPTNLKAAPTAAPVVVADENQPQNDTVQCNQQ